MSKDAFAQCKPSSNKRQLTLLFIIGFQYILRARRFYTGHASVGIMSELGVGNDVIVPYFCLTYNPSLSELSWADC